MMRSVFVGTGGFLGRIDGETRCAFWTEEPTDHGFDPARLITIDLARTLRLVARTLRLPVFGTTRPLMKSHYDERGFNPAGARVLVEASELNQAC